MNRWERVTYRAEREDGSRVRARSIFLRNPKETTLLGAAMLAGIEVDVNDTEVAPRGVDERLVVLDLDLVTDRAEYEQDLNYGWLVPLGTATLGVNR